MCTNTILYPKSSEINILFKITNVIIQLMYGKFSYADTTYEPPNYKDLNSTR